MPTYNDHGIVLNSLNYGEADKILNIYTKENGLVKAICKGAKKINSKFRGKVDKLSCGFFQFARGKNLDIVNDCSQVNAFPLLRSDLLKLTYGILFLEIINGFAHEQDTESSFIYELLYQGLDHLQTVSDPSLFSINFIIENLTIHGYKPQLDSCVMCSSEVNVHSAILQYSFSSALGGLLCEGCSPLVEHKIIDLNVLNIIQGEKILDEKISNETIRSSLKILKDHIVARSHTEIKSFDLVFSL